LFEFYWPSLLKTFLCSASRDIRILTLGNEMIEISKANGTEERETLAKKLDSINFSNQTAVLLCFDRHTDQGEVSDLLHDFNGALRSFRYLADKAKQSYDKDDARGQKMLVSIDRHVESLASLKRDLIDRIFGTY
jgi:hypothetical protein